MKKLIFMLILCAALLAGCTSSGGGGASSGNFADVMGKDWKLIEVQVDSTIGRVVRYNRNDLRRENIANIYTMNFNNEQISGVGAPNRFTAPYTQGEEQSLEVQPVSSTLMAALIQPERLQEQVFFKYLQSANKWEITDGNLIIHTKTEDNSAVRMIFIK
ncbi:MAG: META domain-containing protein [Treponema sp.]|nr:META domain-containing protein [Treponema sp.]